MNRAAIVVLAAATLVLAGCKIVAKSEGADEAQQDDATRMATLVAADWEARVLPRVRETAAPLSDVLGAIASDFPGARASYGVGAAGEGTPTNFTVRGEGTVVGANLTSRAARVNVDVDGDGKADVDLQLGPVIRGTALRDSLPFYEFTRFRDQIEFAKLAGELNVAAHGGMPEPPEDAMGQTVAFTGVFAMNGPDAAKEIVPLDLTWAAP